MATKVITAAEALAQGSNWAQIISIATFHVRAIRSIKPKNFDRLPRYRQEAINLEIRNHQEAIDGIRTVAGEMRMAQEGIGLNG